MRHTTIVMRTPTYFVLASMLGGPLHGSAIIERAAAMSDGRLRLSTGTLYTALDRLIADGFVRTASEETSGGRTRRSYALTPSGMGALRGDTSRMAGRAGRVVARRPREPALDEVGHTLNIPTGGHPGQRPAS